ncbi:UDP-glucose 4-epimerase GalE, partial [Bacteroidetes bacterium SCGC AAA795-G10]
MKILVTGGLGYIGSHVTSLLLEQKIDVICIDNLDNSKFEVLDGINKITSKSPLFKNLDIKDKAKVECLFKEHDDIQAIIHLAAHKSVTESLEKPLSYYNNNIKGLLNILNFSVEKNIPFIYSSSCTVYGDGEISPINEEAATNDPKSPYGNTKLIGEQILNDCFNASSKFKSIILRYFNPIGAHPSGNIGEYPLGTPQNLIPYLTQTVIGKHPFLKIFGSDYNTKDGTCIRDYIHIMDLAKAHIESINYLMSFKNKKMYEIFNVGTGKGYTVLEVIKIFEKVTGEKVQFKFVGPREGDVPIAFADVKKIYTKMGWKAKFTLEDGLKS